MKLSSRPHLIKPPAKPPQPKPQVKPIVEEQDRQLNLVREQILKEAEAQAQEVLAQAQEQSKAVLDEAKRNGYNQGFAQGKEEGRAKGRAEGLSQARAVIVQVQEILAQALGLEVEIQNQLEQELVKLALAIAKKVVGELAVEKEQLVLHTAKRALERVQGELEVTVRVNLEDLELLQRERATLLAQADGIREIKFLEDPRVERGGCLIETNLGTIDARLKTQFAELAKLREEGKNTAKAGSGPLPGKNRAD